MGWNKVKKNTHFKHYKGGDYDFITVVLPSSERPDTHLYEKQKVFHTELQEWVTIYNHMAHGGNCISYSGFDEYFVLYQSRDDLNAERLYLRPLEMFFDMKKDKSLGIVKRFNNQDAEQNKNGGEV
jgi:hypothetical protein